MRQRDCRWDWKVGKCNGVQKRKRKKTSAVPPTSGRKGVVSTLTVLGPHSSSSSSQDARPIQQSRDSISLDRHILLDTRHHATHTLSPPAPPSSFPNASRRPRLPSPRSSPPTTASCPSSSLPRPPSSASPLLPPSLTSSLGPIDSQRVGQFELPPAYPYTQQPGSRIHALEWPSEDAYYLASGPHQPYPSGFYGGFEGSALMSPDPMSIYSSGTAMVDR